MLSVLEFELPTLVYDVNWLLSKRLALDFIGEILDKLYFCIIWESFLLSSKFIGNSAIESWFINICALEGDIPKDLLLSFDYSSKFLMST